MRWFSEPSGPSELETAWKTVEAAVAEQSRCLDALIGEMRDGNRRLLRLVEQLGALRSDVDVPFGLDEVGPAATRGIDVGDMVEFLCPLRSEGREIEAGAIGRVIGIRQLAPEARMLIVLVEDWHVLTRPDNVRYLFSHPGGGRAHRESAQ